MKGKRVRKILGVVLAAQLLLGNSLFTLATENAKQSFDYVQTWDFEDAQGAALPESFQLMLGDAKMVETDGNRVIQLSGNYPNVFIGNAFGGDLDFQARFRVLKHEGTGGLGLHFREQAVNGKLGYTTVYEENNSKEAKLIIRKRVGQTMDPVKDKRVSLDGAGQWHTLRILMEGKKASLYLDGELQLEQELTGFDEGKVGLWAYKDTVQFDDIVLKLPEKPSEPVTIDKQTVTLVEGKSAKAEFTLNMNGNQLSDIYMGEQKLKEGVDYSLESGEKESVKVSFTEAMTGKLKAGQNYKIRFNFDNETSLEAQISVILAGNQVKRIQWENFNTNLVEGKLSEDLQLLIQYIDKYIVNKWWNEKKNFDSQDAKEYLDLGGTQEHTIRPLSHQARTLAASLKLNIYNEDIAKVSREEAMEMAVKLTKSLAKSHKANTANGWGKEWQSAFWAADAGQAGWMLWDELDARDQENVRAMVEYEANRFIGYQVPYYKDRNGKDIYKGDSKSEENSWNADLLMLAVGMMPEHENVKAWRSKGVELMLSAFAVPSDCVSEEVVNGFKLGKTMNGYNMEENGMVINHDRMHPDYLSTIYQNVVSSVSCALGNIATPKAALHNTDIVYEAFVNFDLSIYDKPGQNIYVKDKEGNATFELVYPQGTDWGTDRQINFFLLDVMADGLGFDENCVVKGKDWAAARMPEMLRMQQRGSNGDLSSLTGEYYRSGDKDSYASREEWVSYHAISAYLSMWVFENNMVRITNENYSNVQPENFTSIALKAPEKIAIGESVQTDFEPNKEIPYLDESFASITYTSSAPEVIAVSDTGEMSGLKEGSAEITISVDFAGVVHSDTVTVRVVESPEFNLEIYAQDFEGGEIPEEFELLNGNWVIEEEDGNKILRQIGTSGGLLIGDALEGDFAIEVNYRQAEKKEQYSGSGLYLREQGSEKDGYSVNIGQISEQPNRGIELRERSTSGGIVNNVYKTGEISRNRWHTLRAEVWQGTISVYVDGELILENDYDTYDAGKVGLWAYKEKTDFDNLRIFRNRKEYDKIAAREALQEDYDAFKNIESGNYTEESWSRFWNALEAARMALEDSDKTTQELKQIQEELKAAKEALKEKPADPGKEPGKEPDKDPDKDSDKNSTENTKPSGSKPVATGDDTQSGAYIGLGIAALFLAIRRKKN